MTSQTTFLGLLQLCLTWKPKDRLILVWFLLSFALAYVASQLLQGKTEMTPLLMDTWFYPFLGTLFSICYAGSILQSQVYRTGISCTMHQLSTYFFSGILMTTMVASYVILKFVYFEPLQWQLAILLMLGVPWGGKFLQSLVKAFIRSEVREIKRSYNRSRSKRR